MRKTFLPFSPPLIGDEEIAEVVDTLRSDWITTGPKVKRFEQEFAEAVDAPAALAVNSCTAALHVALAALKIGAGDAVITTPLTFCSTAHVIEHVGARPILVDVDAETLNLDPGCVREAVKKLNAGSRKSGPVKALLPVHLYGHPCEMDTLLAIASEFGLAVVEDAAHALPAKYNGQPVGSLCKNSPTELLTAFSFYATKNLTTAEGGMLTGNVELLDRARVWSMHGMSRDAWKRYSGEGSWHYEIVCPGFKYNMTDIQAAMGLHQLRKLPGFHARRRRIVQQYNAAFHNYPELQPPTEGYEVEHAWHLYVLRLNLEQLSLTRNQFISELRDHNIGCSVHFIPLHLHAYYREKYGYRPEDFAVANREYHRIVSLPLSPRMSDGDVNDVIEAVTTVVRKHSVGAMSSRGVGAAAS